MNILLHEHLLPKISGFGVSRFVSERAARMAPELFHPTARDTWVNVSGFRLMLSSMQTKFPALPAVRPDPLPSEAPHGITDLIRGCEVQNRPRNQCLRRQLT
jgi:hypothetical protein